jgi:hypothetical protein
VNFLVLLLNEIGNYAAGTEVYYIDDNDVYELTDGSA